MLLGIDEHNQRLLGFDFCQQPFPHLPQLCIISLSSDRRASDDGGQGVLRQRTEGGESEERDGGDGDVVGDRTTNVDVNGMACKNRA